MSEQLYTRLRTYRCKLADVHYLLMNLRYVGNIQFRHIEEKDGWLNVWIIGEKFSQVQIGLRPPIYMMLENDQGCPFVKTTSQQRRELMGVDEDGIVEKICACSKETIMSTGCQCGGK